MMKLCCQLKSWCRYIFCIESILQWQQIAPELKHACLHGNFWFVLLWIVNLRLLTGSANLWTVTTGVSLIQVRAIHIKMELINSQLGNCIWLV